MQVLMIDDEKKLKREKGAFEKHCDMLKSFHNNKQTNNSRIIIYIIIDLQQVYSAIKTVQSISFETTALIAWLEKNKKDGYRQRNVRQFLHILASPGSPLGQSR